MKPMEVVTEGKWPHLTLTLAVLCLELCTHCAVLSAQTSSTLHPSQCHCVAPTLPGMEVRALLCSCGVVLSILRGPDAVLEEQRMRIEESCIHTLRLHILNFIPSSASELHLQ